MMHKKKNIINHVYPKDSDSWVKMSKIAITKTIIYTLNLFIFILLMCLRTCDRSFIQAIAKNSAILTAISLGLLVLSARRTEPESQMLWQIIHECSAMTLLVCSLVHSIAHLLPPPLLLLLPIQQQQQQLFFICTGSIMLSSIIVISLISIKSIRRRYYDFFYVSHVIGFLLIGLAAVLHSPVFLAPSIALYACAILSQRALTLCRQHNHDLRVHHLTESFVILDIHVPRVLCCTGVNWAQCKHKHELTVWLVCPQISYLQRHPFTVFEHEQCWSGYCRLRVMISNNNKCDWKHELNNLIQQAFSERIGEKLLPTIFVDTLRRQAYPHKMLTAPVVLFILKNVGISSFFAYLQAILSDPRLQQQTTNRQIVLHYQCCRYDYLSLLAERLMKYKSSIFVIYTTVYMLRYQNIGSHFRGKLLSDLMCIKSNSQLNVTGAIIEASRIYTDVQQQQQQFKQKRPFCYTNERAFRDRVAASALVDSSS